MAESRLNTFSRPVLGRAVGNGSRWSMTGYFFSFFFFRESFSFKISRGSFGGTYGRGSAGNKTSPYLTNRSVTLGNWSSNSIPRGASFLLCLIRLKISFVISILSSWNYSLAGLESFSSLYLSGLTPIEAISKLTLSRFSFLWVGVLCVLYLKQDFDVICLSKVGVYGGAIFLSVPLFFEKTSLCLAMLSFVRSIILNGD